MSEVYPVLGLKESIEQRRAARAFSREPVPPETLREVLRLGMRAPSGFNLQPWRFVVVSKKANRQKLQACAFDQRQVGEAPVVLICCGDRRALQSENIEAVIALGQANGSVSDEFAEFMRASIPGFVENMPCCGSLEVWTNRHVMLAVAQMMVVAKSFDLDSCPMEGFDTAQVKAAFNIPAEVDVCCLLALGYAASPYKKFGDRFGLDRVCYSESYGEAYPA